MFKHACNIKQQTWRGPKKKTSKKVSRKQKRSNRRKKPTTPFGLRGSKGGKAMLDNVCDYTKNGNATILRDSAQHCRIWERAGDFHQILKWSQPEPYSRCCRIVTFLPSFVVFSVAFYFCGGGEQQTKQEVYTNC